jgi:hypothetical protein
VVRRSRKQSPEVSRGACLSRLIAGLASLVNLTILTSFVVVLSVFLMVDERALESYYDVPVVWILSLLSSISTIGLVVCAGQAWKNKHWGVLGRVHYTLVAFSGLVFVPFLLYWDLLGFCGRDCSLTILTSLWDVSPGIRPRLIVNGLGDDYQRKRSGSTRHVARMAYDTLGGIHS